MVTAFTFSLASSIFMITNSRGFDFPHWIDFDAFRLFFFLNLFFQVKLKAQENVKSHCKFHVAFTIWVI
ncbi:hypothetical protein GQ457_10G016160 [Hibiscus cannabinus]